MTTMAECRPKADAVWNCIAANGPASCCAEYAAVMPACQGFDFEDPTSPNYPFSVPHTPAEIKAVGEGLNANCRGECTWAHSSQQRWW